jgi:hypothetical protein
VVELKLLLLGSHQLRLHLRDTGLTLRLGTGLLLLTLGRHLSRFLLHFAHHLRAHKIISMLRRTTN